MIELTAQNFDEIILKNDILVVDCWASWCAPCLSFEPVFEQVAQRYPHIAFAKLNTEEQSDLAQEFMIRSIPTIMIFRQQIMLFCESGVLPASALEDLIQQAQALDMQAVRHQLQSQEQ